MLRRASIAALLVASSILTACGSSGDAPEAVPVSDTTSATPTTRVPRQVDQSDRPLVVFDPCLDIPDEALVEAGYDPQTKEEDAVAADYHTFLICSFDTRQRQYGLNVLSSNITFAEQQKKIRDYSTPIEINGRRALLEVRRAELDTCTVSVEASYGILIVSRVLFSTRSDYIPAYEDWCNGLEETASIIARYLPVGTEHE
ncbi:DUF3558 domain-containing protein [Rhodococcus marinonascens]|uniref:DUF3558 domain-containing protein n=1 Tax=Rhodococcus marinonascens TaxID=38311 RepID=UPI0009FF8BC5|nr:DUF3558 domain-containing protein [Rhodococcus marinonascens]